MGTRVSQHIVHLVVFAGFLCGACAARSTPTGNPPAPAAAGAARSAHENLDAVLWVQTSAEYRVLASTAYRTAQNALDLALTDRSWTAALEQTAGYETLPGAVILDLDETLFDNTRFQAELILEGTGYVPATWSAWTKTASAGLVPGAKEFVAFAEQRGVKVFFVTGRTADEQAATLQNLASLGVKASDDNVLCTGENGWTSDKTTRRALIAKTHRVLLLVGDDMNDFVSTATLTPQQRVDLALKHADRWGSKWILIANPEYGSWNRALYQDLSNPKDDEILQRKRSLLIGFRQ